MNRWYTQTKRFKTVAEFQQHSQEVGKDGWKLHTFLNDPSAGIVYPYIGLWTKKY